jgi:hypothetical protein
MQPSIRFLIVCATFSDLRVSSQSQLEEGSHPPGITNFLTTCLTVSHRN